MNQASLRISALFLISIFLFPQSITISKGCGDSGEYDIKDNSMFIPEIIKETRFDPFFLSIWDYYDGGITEGRIEPNPISQSDYNLKEWRSYFGGIPIEQVSKIVYQQSIASMDSFILICTNKLSVNDDFYKFAAGKTNLKEGFIYLKIAKQIESELNKNPWSADYEDRDEQKLMALSNEVLTHYRNNRNNSLRMRYGFQYVRLCHASAHYQEGIRFVNSEYLFKPEEGFMYYRTLGYQAACYYRERQYDRANIIYARLYDLGEAFKFEAFQSFHPQSDAEWNKTLNLAANNREKEVLWHLFGVYADPIRGIKEIAAINPNSDLLPLLLVRAINIAETNIISNPNINNYGESQDDNAVETEYTIDPLFSWQTVHKEQLNNLQLLINTIAAERKQDKGVWYVANAFIYYLNDDYFQSSSSNDLAESNSEGNKMIQTQVSINRMLIEVSQLKEITESDEYKMMLLIRQVIQNSNGNVRHENAIRYALLKMKALYLQQEQILMSELCEPDIYKFYDGEKIVQEMIDFMVDPNLSPFKKYLLKRYPVQVSELYDVLATARIYNYDFKGALEVYNKNPSAGNLELLGNPFNYRTVDCHDCDHEMKQRIKYTKRTFVEKMIELKAKGENENDPIERSNNYFLFANGLYNMTYYGNARLVASTVVNWNYMDSNRFAGYYENERPTGEYYNCKNPLTYYLFAKELNPNQEFKAKCVWMAAKCEHNLWLEGDSFSNESADFESGEYFKQMKEQFANTKYYKEVIAECGYFCQYINPGEANCIKNK